MPLQILRQDITRMRCDAIVNAANESLLGGGGVDGQIHRAAGPKLLEECRKIGGCPTGEARITKGYDLPSRYVIHTVGPVWHGGTHGEEAQLRACYRSSLALATKHHCRTVAFPLISGGIYGYPKDQALHVAVDEIGRFLMDHEMMVYMVIFDKEAFSAGQKMFAEVKAYIDDVYAAGHYNMHEQRRKYAFNRPESSEALDLDQEMAVASRPQMMPMAPMAPMNEASSLEDMLRQKDESFSQMLLRLIDERGMKDAECYKKANIDRKLFSKIRSNMQYRPSKQTAVAFALALQLDEAETGELLAKAGYALSHSFTFDIIIEYCIRKKIYDVLTVNEMLFAFDQTLLGA